jgi:hypothetical protein
MSEDRGIAGSCRMAHKSAILACDVFADELRGLEVSSERIVWLEMGLHDRPDLLRLEIQKNIGQIENDPAIETILLVYGLCGNGLAGIRAGRCHLVLPRAHEETKRASKT